MEPEKSSPATPPYTSQANHSADPDEPRMELGRPGELMFVNQVTVEKLTEGLISHYLPDLQQSKTALQELTQNQVVLLDTLEQEIGKFRECHLVLDINALFTEAKCYYNKLVNIRKEMITLHEKTTKLKKVRKDRSVRTQTVQSQLQTAGPVFIPPGFGGHSGHRGELVVLIHTLKSEDVSMEGSANLLLVC